MQGAREPFVVLEEPAQASFAFVLDTDAYHGPGHVIAHGGEGPQDPVVDILRIGRSSISVVGIHEDAFWIQLLGIFEEDLIVQCFLDPLRSLEVLAKVCVFRRLGCSKSRNEENQ